MARTRVADGSPRGPTADIDLATELMTVTHSTATAAHPPSPMPIPGPLRHRLVESPHEPAQGVGPMGCPVVQRACLPVLEPVVPFAAVLAQRLETAGAALGVDPCRARR